MGKCTNPAELGCLGADGCIREFWLRAVHLLSYVNRRGEADARRVKDINEIFLCGS